MKYWFDTEFIEDGVTIDLLSIGVVCEDGREFYAQNGDANLDAASDWVRDNVFPGLRDCPDDQLLHKDELRDALFHFVNYTHLTTVGADKPEFWAYCGDYDWVVLCQMFGTMMDLPEGWPMFAMDVKQLCMSLGNPRLPEQESTEHNALNDARWTRDAWKFLAVPVLETRIVNAIGGNEVNTSAYNTVEPVPARRVVSQNRLEAEIRLVLQRQYTAAYDLAGDITAILDEYVAEPVPAPRLEQIIENAKTRCLRTIDAWSKRGLDSGISKFRVEEASDILAILSPPVGPQP